MQPKNRYCTFIPQESLIEAIDDVCHVLGNWYDSALYFLGESQFLRVLNVHNIQTIVMLATCFVNFGDFNLYYHLWGCALRMGQALELYVDPVNPAPSPGDLDQTTRTGRWLWWSLVINDWLQIPLQAGHSGVDRITAGPTFPGCIESEYRETEAVEPLHFHLVLAQLATTLRRFHERLACLGDDFSALAFVTTSADNELATIVSHLPKHLQPDEQVTNETRRRDEANPWLPWQKENLCILLLYYRLVISRPLWNARNGDALSYESAKAVCLGVSHGILASIKEFDSGDPILHRRLIWYPILTHTLLPSRR